MTDAATTAAERAAAFAATGPVRAAHRLDETALARYLANAIAEFAGPLEIRQFLGGQSNPSYLLLTPARLYALRKKPPGQLLPSAHLIEREYTAMRALAGSGVPVPRMHHLCEDASIIGTAFYVMDYVHGRIFRDPALPELAPRDRRKIYAALAATLARLHSLDYRAIGLGAFGKPTAYVARQIERWSKQYRASETHSIPAMDELMAWLPRRIPIDDESALSHGDFRLENLIVHAERPEIAAVIDWELSTLGHPLADLAHTCVVYRLPDRGPGLRGLAGHDLAALGIPSEAEFTAAYAAAAGRRKIPDWPFYMAFALFRLGAIVQGIAARALRGSASSADAAVVGSQAALFAELAWREASEMD